MIQYIYFVKCPNCEDEHFDFFDEAKEFALSCLSKKPVITQIEVDRNDFGECVDSTDLGTIWSWEDMMNDENMPEPEASVFSKDNLKDYDPENDPEFQDDNFSAVSDENIAEGVSFRNKNDQAEFRKLCSEIGIKTGTDLNRFMKDHEATNSNVLNKLRTYRAELGDDFAIKEDFVSYYDYDRMTKEELYDRLANKGDIVEIEIGDQGYTLMDTGSFSDGGRYSNSYLSVEFDKEKFIATEWYMSDDGDVKEGDCIIETESFDELWGQLMAFRPTGLAEKYCKKDRKPVPEGMTIEQLIEEMEENEDTVECTWCEDLFDKSECRKEVNLGWLCSRCEAAIKSRGEPLTFRENNYWDFLDEDVEVAEVHDLGNEYDGGYPNEKPELLEIDEVSDSHLKLCPECGKEAFDIETGICVDCGFN